MILNADRPGAATDGSCLRPLHLSLISAFPPPCSFYIITYAMAIYMLNLFLGFLT